jgi:DNA gyrase subunit B
MTDEYDATSIQVLEGLEAVRKRPGMYLGDPHDGSALHHCIWEVVDNSVDEHLAGHTKQIDIVLHPDHSLSVRDYGRGIPVGMHEEFGISAAEVIMTKLHAGGKFDNSSYKVSGGLHGVGVSAVNAVSEWMEMTIHRNGEAYFQRYEAGVPVKPLEKIGTCDDTGTHIAFKPDLSIFTDVIEFNLEEIETRVSETAFLNAGLKITILDERGEEPYQTEHLYEGGLAEYVGQLNERREVLHADVITIVGDKKIEKGPVDVEVALQWSDAFSESIRCYTNIIRNKDGGTHMSGLRTALTSSVNAYAKKKSLLKGESLSG